jgi:hypothetical protein
MSAAFGFAALAAFCLLRYAAVMVAVMALALVIMPRLAEARSRLILSHR